MPEQTAIEVVLELKKLTDDEFLDKIDLIVASMTGNGDFTTPAPPLGQLAAGTYTMRLLINERDDLLVQAQQKTVLIRNARNDLTIVVNNEAGYVQGIANANTNPLKTPTSIAVGAGMGVKDTPTPVGTMPKVTGLTGTQGDADGEIDLHWNPVNTTDPAGQTGWGHTKVCTASKITLTGLTSATRYWFRVAAVGAAGQGPWSDSATKVAP